MKTDPLGIDERLWQRLRYRGAPIKKHVLSDLPDSGAPLIADGVWQSFKQHCAAEGNLVPLLISQLAPQNADAGMFRRRGPRKPKGSDPSVICRSSNAYKRRRDSGSSATGGPGICRPGGVLFWSELPAD